MSNRFEISWVTYDTQRPEFADQSNYIYLERYESVPNWHILINGGIIAQNRIATTGVFNQVDLATLSNWHALNSSNVYSNNITSRYFYRFDGTANSISDGGFDMYDGGNFISLSTTRGVTNILNFQNINYGTLSNITQSNYGFFISQANIWPQISIAYTTSGTIQWRISGGIGTDGGGTNANVSGSYTTTNQGRYGEFWANQVFGTTDPSIVMTWFTILQSNLNSAITSCNDNRRAISPPSDPMNQNFTVTGCNYLFGCFLLSMSTTTGGLQIPTLEIQNFLSNYVTNANIIIT